MSECKMLISRMLCFDPNQRAKLPDILKHPWMRSYVQYKKLKVYNFSNTNNTETQDNNNSNFKKINKSSSSLSLKTSNSKITLPQCMKNSKLNNLLSRTKRLFTFNSSEKINKHYINLQKDQLSLNNPFSSDTLAIVNSIFNNSESNSSNGVQQNVVSQMFAYAVSREDETKENRIKLLKKVMNNQVSFIILHINNCYIHLFVIIYLIIFFITIKHH